MILLLSFEMFVANMAFCQGRRPVPGEVEVRGKVLLRDGQPWVPHGFYQIAFEVAPGNLERADHPFWAIAYNHYTPQEYDDMRSAGRTPSVFRFPRSERTLKVRCLAENF